MIKYRIYVIPLEFQWLHYDRYDFWLKYKNFKWLLTHLLEFKLFDLEFFVFSLIILDIMS